MKKDILNSSILPIEQQEFSAKFNNYLPPCNSDVHKYSRGLSIIVAGSKEYPGAAMLCSEAAGRAGAGYVQLFTSATNKKICQSNNPSLVIKDKKSFYTLDIANTKNTCFALGPGMLPNKKSKDLMFHLLSCSNAPIVIDGSMIELLNKKEFIQPLQNQLNPIILTPHKGELSRWLNKPILKLQNDDDIINYIKEKLSISKCKNMIVVAKSERTIIVSSNKVLYPTPGTDTLACAGSGDVLAGIICGIVAQSYTSKKPFSNIEEICASCVEVHALSGTIASKTYGHRGVLSFDLSKCVGLAIDFLREQNIR